MTYHTCELCCEDAVNERCPNYRLPGEVETAAELDWWLNGHDQVATIVYERSDEE